MNRRVLNGLANLSLFVLTTSVTLIGFEIGLRFLLPQKLYRYPRNLFHADAEIGFSMTPGFEGEIRTSEFRTSLRVNALGFRGPEVGAADPARRRVLVVGDSFVAALNVDESKTFVAVAAQRLEGELGTGKVEFINAGTPNYGTWHEVRVLRRAVPVLEPDAVVLCVFVGNDVEDNLRPLRVVVRDGLLVERFPPRGLLPLPVRSWLQRHSMAYTFGWSAWGAIRARLEGRAQDPLAGFRPLITAARDPDVEDGYRESRAILEEARDLLRGRAIPLVLLVIPHQVQVYPDRLGVPPSGGGLDLNLPDRRWCDMARELDLPTSDLLPIFRAHSGGPPLYMDLDGHLTLEGNRLAGEAIADLLMATLVRPEATR